jgi:MFS family permease
VLSRLLSPAALQALSVAVGWTIYDLQRTPLSLGLIGLCQFVPLALLALPGAAAADRGNPRHVLAWALLAQAGCALMLLALAWGTIRSVWPFYGALVLLGAARGVSAPAGQALLAFVVPRGRLARAVAFSHGAYYIATIAGPLLGGALCAVSPALAFAAAAALLLASAWFVAGLGGRRRTDSAADTRLRTSDAMRFLLGRPILAGTLALELLTVFLAGAVVLLPALARDLLDLGPAGLGLLRAAPAFGAAVAAAAMTWRPPAARLGPTMFAALGLYAAASVGLGMARSLVLAVAAQLLIGIGGAISTVIRSSIATAATPDAMRARIGAVSALSGSAANELGELESGLVAAWLGVPEAIVLGGLAALGATALGAALVGPLRRLDRLDAVWAEAADDRASDAEHAGRHRR